RPPTRQRRSTQPRARTTSNDGVAFKCSHHHNLKSYKHWTDGPQLPNGTRTLNPPTKPPPPDDG
ncbi:MAG TPA: hypothetical protein VGI86_14605, partial [Acidimicrobiia bacterium]